MGTMDVKILPKDRIGIAYTAGMFDGYIYAIDPIAGTGVAAFDMSTVTPHVNTSVSGGMGPILATPKSGDRLLVGMFQAGHVTMLDTTLRTRLKQVAVVTLSGRQRPA